MLIADLRSIRLTCRHLSMLDSVNISLLHSFLLYIHASSLANLDALVKHRTLRQHVREIVFMPPQFYEHYRDAASYVELISRHCADVGRRPDDDDDGVAAALRQACAAGITIDWPSAMRVPKRSIGAGNTARKGANTARLCRRALASCQISARYASAMETGAGTLDAYATSGRMMIGTSASRSGIISRRWRGLSHRAVTPRIAVTLR
jgi:hypothetical protein